MALRSRTEPIYDEQDGRLVAYTREMLAGDVLEEAGGVEAITGPPGRDGAGAVVHTGSGAPSSGVGADGDLYVDARTNGAGGSVYRLWGPKASGSWPSTPYGLLPDLPRGTFTPQLPFIALDEGNGDYASWVSFDLSRIAGTLASSQLASSAVTAAKVAAALKPSGTATDATEALRRLGTASGEAAPGATALHVVAHGATAGTTRPTGAARVLWVGSVEPTNATSGVDLWLRTEA